MDALASQLLEGITPAQQEQTVQQEATPQDAALQQAINKTLGIQQEQAPTQAEIESTSVNDNPMQHTQEEQRVIEGYKKSVNEKLKAFIERVRTLPNNLRNRERIDIDTQTTNAVQKAAELTGVDTTGFGNEIKGNTIQHIDKRHGVNGEHDSSMSNIEDFSRIGYVLDNFTNAEIVFEGDSEASLSREYRNKDNTWAKTVKYSMPINGVYYVVEAVPDTKLKKMEVVSAYIGKNKNGTTLTQALNMPDGAPSNPQSTSETPVGMLDSSFMDTISQPAAQSQEAISANSQQPLTTSAQNQQINQEVSRTTQLAEQQPSTQAAQAQQQQSFLPQPEASGDIRPCDVYTNSGLRNKNETIRSLNEQQLEANPDVANYKTQTHADTTKAARARIDQNGYTGEYDRLLNAETWDSADLVEAQMALEQFFKDGEWLVIALRAAASLR